MEELEAAAFGEFVRENDPFLLDVREIHEWEERAIPGTVNIPLRDVPRRLHEIPRDRMIVAICEVGARSAKAGEYLAKQGYEKIFNLAGGTAAWAENQ